MTANEMRISDWSSDVCSSDLTAVDVAQQAPLARAELGLAGERLAASLRQQCQADAGFVLLMEGSDGLDGAIQSGDAGVSNVVSVWQSGAGQSALPDQYASAGMPNHATLIQDGTANKKGRANARKSETNTHYLR